MKGRVNRKMYTFRQDIQVKYKQKDICETIGITQPTMSNIMNGKVACRKVVAYCITKYLDPDAEIEKYFERVR